MKLIEVKDYQEMSHVAADYLLSKVNKNKKITLGLATGGTPQGLYKALIADHQENNTSYQQVSSFNLDEYIGLSGDHPNSYCHYMNENLFNHIDIPLENTHIPSGKAADLDGECEAYDEKIHSEGGIDLQVLGIGSNGHIGFNEPGTSFDSPTHIVELTQSTREANARYFDSINDVPTHAITMGIASILKSKEILLLASGHSKQKALKKLVEGEISEDFPASVLNRHLNVTVIADKEALALVKDHKLMTR
ncbi:MULTISPECIES: glucosamine-6-phosphate deaminase [Rossellomorea]|uniref:glucosamine-6-phosphate deaminase n=1 Tax=Rossellomorea TaxID=2837508 RepID=UPI001CCC23EB|nr:MULTISPECIES: glucosamine-6-phosphate deaminase [Rossellomorea]MCA0150865.1 glucosamine-6-phosphate deaminase [Rossellomorea vietnamensis]UTE77026.1 glucosamine-6-phosphate deaminase [Rossellomorea sp. KS-H15a]WGG44942.1 glucosamine-6-phosphate deaminase [Rossellomorea sp. DA94]